MRLSIAVSGLAVLSLTVGAGLAGLATSFQSWMLGGCAVGATVLSFGLVAMANRLHRADR